ncbi:MAG: hypothetical protein M3P82_05080 [Bacteroidota bacterium]|nr:hypothetical protein [Bacteroidota bacterium]
MYQYLISHNCPVCEDEKQYIQEAGETWTNLDDISTHYKLNTNFLSLQLIYNQLNIRFSKHYLNCNSEKVH